MSTIAGLVRAQRVPCGVKVMEVAAHSRKVLAPNLRASCPSVAKFSQPFG